MRHSLCFPGLFVLAACAAPIDGAPEKAFLQPDYSHPNEAASIANSNGRARRIGDDLVLTFADGHTKSFRNDDKGCEDGPDHCHSYVLAAALPNFHWFLVVQRFYEGGKFDLYDDRAGLLTELPYEPVFSPDGQRILIQNDDVTSEFPGDNLEIWRREGNRMEREWAANPDERDTGISRGPGLYHSEVQSWQGDRIVLIFSVPGAYDLKTRTSAPGRSWPATLTRKADGWHLSARAP
jgi:hypothetical protein